MLEHPGTELQLLIKEKGLTQKAFSSILGKKVSEVNELLKGKRNITIQRDYLLHQTLGTPIKYWILKQIDYDYSLIDIEETNNLSSGAIAKDLRGKTEESNTQDSSVASLPQNDTLPSSGATAKDLMGKTEESNTQDSSVASLPQNDTLSSSGATAKDLKGETEELNTQDSSSSLHSSSEGQEENEDDEDFKNRARIFKTF